MRPREVTIMVRPESMYRQCKLEKRSGAAVLSRVLWGPAKSTVVGNPVMVEEDDGSWSGGWTVAAVYGEPMPEKLVVHRSHDHTRQRAASDI
jgi:hypothetical protein